LVEVLKERRILGAALDVMEQIPPSPGNPILGLDNLILTPHVAGLTYDTWERRGQFIFRNLQRVWDGNTPLSIVQEEMG
jgi:phosphoglycerate dehydrogenase-like enzyme